MQFIDVMDYLVLPDQSKGIIDPVTNKPYSRQTHGLTGPAGPAWDVVDFTPDADGWFRRYRVKSNHTSGQFVGGWPWDVSRFNAGNPTAGDHGVILSYVTELGWTTPRDYKMNIQNYTDAAGKTHDGKIMFPRFINAEFNLIQTPILKANTLYHMFNNCKWDQQPHYLNDNLEILFGPIMYDHGGTIGLIPTLVHQYLWGGSAGVYTVKEENLYGYHYGWTRWTLHGLDPVTGSFKMSKTQARDTLLAQPAPTVLHPCF